MAANRGTVFVSSLLWNHKVTLEKNQQYRVLGQYPKSEEFGTYKAVFYRSDAIPVTHSAVIKLQSAEAVEDARISYCGQTHTMHCLCTVHCTHRWTFSVINRP